MSFPGSDWSDGLINAVGKELGINLVNELKSELGINLGSIVSRGFSAGLKKYSPRQNISNLSLVYGVGLYYHGLGVGDVKGWFEDAAKEEQTDEFNVDVTIPMFFNLPVTIGGNYTVQLPNTSASIYGEAALGLNISYITKGKIELNAVDLDAKINTKGELSFDPAFGFCYGLEAGIGFNNKFHIGVRYNNLGTHSYKYKIEGDSSHTDGYGYGETYHTSGNENGTLSKVKLSNTALVLGIRF